MSQTFLFIFACCLILVGCSKDLEIKNVAMKNLCAGEGRNVTLELVWNVKTESSTCQHDANGAARNDEVVKAISDVNRYKFRRSDSSGTARVLSAEWVHYLCDGQKPSVRLTLDHDTLAPESYILEFEGFEGKDWKVNAQGVELKLQPGDDQWDERLGLVGSAYTRGPDKQLSCEESIAKAKEAVVAPPIRSDLN